MEGFPYPSSLQNPCLDSISKGLGGNLILLKELCPSLFFTIWGNDIYVETSIYCDEVIQL